MITGHGMSLIAGNIISIVYGDLSGDANGGNVGPPTPPPTPGDGTLDFQDAQGTDLGLATGVLG